MATVSVIIPCYNSENYIVRCLKALERQNFKDFEVLIGDDCSKDGSVKRIREYMEKSSMNIRLFQNSVNTGPAKVRNSLLKAATTEYICFCDSDDWYEEDYLELMMNEVTEHASDLVFCNYKLVFDRKKEQIIDKLPNVDYNISREQVLQLNVDSLCMMMVKRSLFDNIEMPDIRNGEDMAIVPVLEMRAAKYAFVRKPIYNYYCRQGSASMTSSMSVVHSLVQSFDYIEDHIGTEYPKVCEFLGVRNLLYGALLNLFKFSYDVKTALRIIEGFEEKYPHWERNPLISGLSMYKRVFLKCAEYRMYIGIKLLSELHKFLTR